MSGIVIAVASVVMLVGVVLVIVNIKNEVHKK